VAIKLENNPQYILKYSKKNQPSQIQWNCFNSA